MSTRGILTNRMREKMRWHLRQIVAFCRWGLSFWSQKGLTVGELDWLWVLNASTTL